MNFQSATVILGVLPSVLGSLGARLSETSYLSVHRPVLSLLLAVGSPGIWMTWPFEYDNPVETVKQSPSQLVMPSFKEWPRASGCLSALQYMLVLASIANLVEISLQLGRKTIVSWRCTFDYGPLLWVLTPIVVHLIASVTFKFEIRDEWVEYMNSCQHAKPKPESRLKRGSGWWKIFQSLVTAPLTWSLWPAESRICANREKGLANRLAGKKFSKRAVLLNCTASVLVYGMFGWLIPRLEMDMPNTNQFIWCTGYFYLHHFKYVKSWLHRKLFSNKDLVHRRLGYHEHCPLEVSDLHGGVPCCTTH